MTRRGTQAALAAAAAIALGGCWDLSSEVAVISDATRATSVPTQPGTYCTLSTNFDDAGALLDVFPEDECFALDVKKGALVVPWDDEGTLRSFAVAPLGRGAYLLESRSAEDAGEVDPEYLLVIAMMRAEGVVVLPELRAGPETLADAAAAGVVIDADADDVADAAEDPVGLHILSGDADAAFGVIRDATGRRFDAALRDPALAHELLTESFFYVKVEGEPETPPEELEPDESVLRAGVAALQEAIGRAMTLE